MKIIVFWYVPRSLTSIIVIFHWVFEFISIEIPWTKFKVVQLGKEILVVNAKHNKNTEWQKQYTWEEKEKERQEILNNYKGS